MVRLIAFSLLCTGFIAMALDKLYGWGMQHTLAGMRHASLAAHVPSVCRRTCGRRATNTPLCFRRAPAAATMMKLALCVWGLSASLFLGALEVRQ